MQLSEWELWGILPGDEGHAPLQRDAKGQLWGFFTPPLSRYR